MTDPIREHITDIRQLAEEMALTAEGVPGMNLALSKARIASVCRAFLAATATRPEEKSTKPTEAEIDAAIKRACGKYRVLDSYTYEDVHAVVEAVFSPPLAHFYCKSHAFTGDGRCREQCGQCKEEARLSTGDR